MKADMRKSERDLIPYTVFPKYVIEKQMCTFESDGVWDRLSVRIR